MVYDGVLGPDARDIVALFEVVCDYDDGLRILQAGEVRRHPPGAEAGLDGGSCCANDRPNRSISRDVEHVARDSAPEPRFLIGRRGANEHTHASAAGGRLQRGRSFRDGVLERCRGLDLATPHEVLSETFARLQGIVVIASAHADLIAAHRVALAWPDDDATAVFRAELDAAANRT